jgi:ribulose kinase
LDAKIKLARSEQSVALGAAILGCIAAGKEATGYSAISQAIQAMAGVREDVVYRPDIDARKKYSEVYGFYRRLAENGEVRDVMRGLRGV